MFLMLPIPLGIEFPHSFEWLASAGDVVYAQLEWFSVEIVFSDVLPVNAAFEHARSLSRRLAPASPPVALDNVEVSEMDFIRDLDPFSLAWGVIVGKGFDLPRQAHQDNRSYRGDLRLPL